MNIKEKNIHQILLEKVIDNLLGNHKSDTLFFLQSSWGRANKKYDHVGFILKDGRLKDMSGHRGEMVSPMIQTWTDLMRDEAFWSGYEKIPETQKEAEQMGILKTIKLNKTIDVPNGIVCQNDNDNKKAENCGSFVYNVLYNAGINPSFLKGKQYSVVGKNW